MLESMYRSLQSRNATVLGSQRLLQSAVLLPIVEIENVPFVLFEERAHHLNRQPGEICFPGGRIDPEDENAEAAAVRETCEELGLEQESVELIGPLDYLVTSLHIVHPFVGRITDPGKLNPNPDEVADVFYVPLSFLRQTTPELHYVDLQVNPPDEFPFHLIPQGKYYKWRAGQIPEYFYFYENRIIWGLTARILHHFLEVTAGLSDQEGL